MRLPHGKRVVIVLLLLLAGGWEGAFAFEFTADWDYRAQGGEGIETRHAFEQRYSLGAGSGITYEPTSAISMSGNLIYIRRERFLPEGGTALEESLSPTASLSVINDIFRTTLTGSVTKHRDSESPDFTGHSWQAELASGWRKVLWPNLTGSVGQRETSNFTSGSQELSRTRETDYYFNFDWDLLIAKFFYGYSRTRTEDLLGGSEGLDAGHFARVETEGLVWGKRLNYKISQQYQQETSTFSVGALVNGVFNERLTGGTTASNVGEPPTAPELTLPALTSGPLLGDGVVDASQGVAVSIPSNKRGQLAIQFFSGPKQVDQLQVYFTDTIPPLTAAQASQLHWSLYEWRVVDGTWNLLATDIPATYNAIDKRFELAIAREGSGFQLVVTNTASVPLQITELQAVRRFTQSGANTSSRHTSNLTNINMTARLTSTLTASSNFAFESSKDDQGNTTDTRALSGYLRWTPVPFFAPSAGFSEIRQQQSDALETINRSYSVTVSTFPLPDVNVAFGFTRSQQYVGDVETGNNNNYTLTATAQVYPDLTAAFNNSYLLGKTVDAGGNEFNTANVNSHLLLTARVNPALTADFDFGYQNSKTDAGSNNSENATVTLGYRPSDLLTAKLSATKSWSSQQSAPLIVEFASEVALLRTSKARVTFQYDRVQSTDTTTTYRIYGTWDISRNLAFQTQGQYAQAGVGTWSMLSTLSLRL